MNIYVILAYFVFIADVLVCFSLYFYSYFLFNGILVICLCVYYVGLCAAFLANGNNSQLFKSVAQYSVH